MRQSVRVAVVISVLFAAAFSGAAADVQAIKESGVLTVISFPHQESEFVRTNLDAGPTPELGPPGRFVGLDIDLMVAFAAKLGVNLQIRRASEPSYGVLIPDLLAGKGDLIASSFSITDERRKLVNFSDPYFTVYKVVVAPVGVSMKSLDTIRKKRVAVIKGSSHHELLQNSGVPADKFVFVDFTADCFEAAATGQADYTLQDSLAAQQHLENDSRLEIKFRLPGEDSYGFAVPKESTAMLAALNEFLAEERSSGRLAEAINRHILQPID